MKKKNRTRTPFAPAGYSAASVVNAIQKKNATSKRAGELSGGTVLRPRQRPTHLRQRMRRGTVTSSNGNVHMVLIGNFIRNGDVHILFIGNRNVYIVFIGNLIGIFNSNKQYT